MRWKEREEDILRDLDYNDVKIEPNTKLLTKDKTFIRFAIS